MRVHERLKSELSAAKRKFHPALQFPLLFAVFSLSQSLMTPFLTLPMMAWLYTSREFWRLAMDFDIKGAINYAMNMPDWLMLLMLYLTVFELVLPILYCRLAEGRSLSSVGFVKKGAVKQYLVGYLIGAALILSTVGISIVTGQSRITFTGVTFSTILVVIAYFFGYLIQGAAEEVLFRGFFMLSFYGALNRLRERKGSAVLAVLVSAFLFAFAHVLNPGFTPLAFLSIFLTGILFGLYILRTGSILGACAMHSAWNFILGNILGVQVSGTMASSSIFHTVDIGKTSFINGGAFGLEGGIGDIVVTCIAILLVLFLPRLSKNKDESIETAPSL